MVSCTEDGGDALSMVVSNAVVYRKGSLNTNADALSRLCSLTLSLPHFSSTELQLAQRADHTYTYEDITS